MSKLISVGDYLLIRLSELGIDTLFGVPGDYNLLFLDKVANSSLVKWVGNCNELNAGYAADGYARVKGAGAVLTTFGVGELSAINSIAGSFAEYVPVVKIVGAPSLAAQRQQLLLHHTFGTGDFNVFSNAYKELTSAQTLLKPKNVTQEIDRVLHLCWVKKQPVYISLPSDLVEHLVTRPEQQLDLNYPISDHNAAEEMATRTSKLLMKAQRPVILVDICAVRHPMRELILQLLDKTGFPFANMNMGKGLIDESHPQFIGSYNGKYSIPSELQQRVENSDCILSFGSVFSDFNTGGFTTNIKADVSIEIHSNHVKVRQSLYPNLYFNASIPALIAKLTRHPISTSHFNQRVNEVNEFTSITNSVKNEEITQNYFWTRMSAFFQDNDIVIAEIGTSLFGLISARIPDGVTFIGQSLWGSIGYSVGALLGAAIAGSSRRTILFVGDGSFQVTAQEISTVLRQKLTPIIFLINNDGYTIERIIHGPNMEYNNIQRWNYRQFVESFGADIWTSQVTTPQMLEKTLQEIPNHSNVPVFIEVIMDRMDCPETLRLIGEECASRNKGEIVS